MAEHDSDREDREERDLEREHREGRERAADGGPEAQDAPFDEDAAWASIVAGYGEEPRTRRAPSRSSRSRTWRCSNPR